MDLRSIINSEEQSTARQPKNAGPPQSPIYQAPNDYKARAFQATPSRDGSQYGRPPAPPPLQAPPQDFRSPAGSMTYSSVQSPYQTTPPSAGGGGGGSGVQGAGQGQHPFPPNPPSNASNTARSSSQHMSHPASSYPPHLAPASYGLQSPSPYTPTGTTPTYQNHPHHQQAHSTQSSPTPHSAGSQAPYPYRDSPISAHSQSQYYSGHSASQPGTPLGPPMTHARAVSSSQQDPHNSFAHSRGQSGGSFTGASLTYVASPTSSISGGPPSSTSAGLASSAHIGGAGIADGRRTETSAHSTPLPMHRQQPSHIPQEMARSRTRSLSVSPKTQTMSRNHENPPREHSYESAQEAAARQSSRPQEGQNYVQRNGSTLTPEHSRVADPNTQLLRESQAPSTDNSRANSRPAESQASSSGRLGPERTLPPGKPMPPTNSASNGVSMQISAGTSSPNEPMNPISRQQSFTGSLSQSDGNAQRQSMTASPLAKPGRQPVGARNDSTPPIKSKALSVKRDRSQAPSSPDSAASHKPHKKRRYNDPPIWAQRAKNSNKIGPVPGQRNFQGSHIKTKRLQASASANLPQDGKKDTNGLVPPTRSNTLLQAAPDLGVNGPLGSWEPSFTNVIPSEELTRSVMDFLFKQVVMRDDVDGASASGTAVLEIEAKIGQLIDRNTNERIRLPVSTECVVNSNDPGIKLTFKSSMTVSQHKLLNDTLNEALKFSMLPPRKRMTYLHRRERDSFYELSQNAHMTLPASIRNSLNPRHNVKLRVTTDQKTGATLARIIKVRVADLDVYSPKTLFDWRISVNLEMNYEGDVSDLVESSDAGRRGDRNKDRMSYTHQAYQIDLTQVTPSDSTALQDKEHELEVEVSTSEVRNQGQLARDRKPNQYEELVKGFVDNVRVLARIVK